MPPPSPCALAQVGPVAVSEQWALSSATAILEILQQSQEGFGD